MYVAITSPYLRDRGVTISKSQKWFKKFEICVEFFHTSLYINVLYWTYFLWIFREFYGIYLTNKNQVFNPLFSPVLASAGRPDRSTELGVGRPCRSTDVHSRARQLWLEGRSTGSVDRQRLLLSGKPRSTGSVDRQRALLSVPGCGRSSRSTEAPTVNFLTVGGRPGRSTASRESWKNSPTASFCWRLFIPHLYGTLTKNFRAKNFRSLLLF